jgi:hypothetical protein
LNNVKKESLGLVSHVDFLDALVQFAAEDSDVAFAGSIHLEDAVSLTLLLAHLERSALGSRDDQHTLVGIGLVHRFADAEAIFEGDVMKLL